MRTEWAALATAAALMVGGLLYRHAGDLPPSFAERIPKGKKTVSTFRGKIDAPEFPGGMQWLNTDRPITLKDLRGKVVVLDFWTYCCMNCMHVLPELKKLERKYPDELVVIGVHSAKFTAEKDTDNIRQAILRYEIEHPVLNDKDMLVWRAWSVRAWPTLYVIDPEGKIVGYTSGEDVYEPFDKLIAGIIREFDKDKKIDRKRPGFKLERERAAKTMLSFPGKVLADEKSGRLFIADSNNNRIVVATLDGTVTGTVGSGTIGLKDGSFDEARFNKPQGLALAGDTLYVADTENHAVRRVDLAKKTVDTLAGTGRQSRRFLKPGQTQKKDAPLNSPWALVLHAGKLYVAMAGPHQLWTIDPDTGGAGPYAGSGREARIDGPFARAALAQPSGITTDGRKLYFADSEVSAIRSADLSPRGEVETIVGVDLFEFGDVDGAGATVRLQHPLGVVFHEDTLYVADTYNNRIKRVDPAKKTAKTFLGSGDEGLKDGPASAARFDEPGGLSVAAGKLYIADTNNHVIRVADLKTKTVATLTLKGLTLPAPPEPGRATGKPDLTLAPSAVADGKGTLLVSVDVPPKTKLTPGAPTVLRLSAADGDVTFADGGKTTAVKVDAFPAEVSFAMTGENARVHVALSVFYCSEANAGLCYFREALIEVPLVTGFAAKAGPVVVHYRVPR